MKIYTRTGDEGSTSLFGGQRIGKDALRIETYGTVDELNSVLGLAAAVCTYPQLLDLLRVLQGRLFELGAELAAPPRDATSEKATAVAIDSGAISALEQAIDEHWQHLPPLRSFILPGGSDLAARLHMARCVCRRAERLCVTLAKQETVRPEVIVYLNRLSDLLFALARRANQLAQIDDIEWHPEKKA